MNIHKVINDAIEYGRCLNESFDAKKKVVEFPASTFWEENLEHRKVRQRQARARLVRAASKFNGFDESEVR